MTTKPWHYLENQFDNVTQKSFKLMNTINADHYARLQAQQADPDIAALLARTTPLHNNFNTAYSNWISAKGVSKGETDRLQGYVDELRNIKIKQWDMQIQAVYFEGTPDYIILLPNERKPFNTGTIDDRISQVQGLGQRLANYPALNATMNDVNSFYATITAARDVQQQKEALLNNASDSTETARKALADVMYQNLGVMMNKYIANLNLITNFWELSLLTSSGSGNTPPPPPPVVDAITATTNQAALQAIAILLSSNTASGGEQVTINWGDNTNTPVTLSNMGTVSYPHNYSSTNNYNVSLTGALASIGSFQFPNSKLTALAFPDSASTGNFGNIVVNDNLLTSLIIPATFNGLINLNANNNNLDANSINGILMTINNFGTSNGIINLGGGSNASPTGQGNAAKNALTSRGWTVITN